jgi:hypothetical protein
MILIASQQAAEKTHMLRCAQIASPQRTLRVRLCSSIFVRLAYEVFEQPADTVFNTLLWLSSSRDIRIICLCSRDAPIANLAMFPQLETVRRQSF